MTFKCSFVLVQFNGFVTGILKACILYMPSTQHLPSEMYHVHCTLYTGRSGSKQRANTEATDIQSPVVLLQSCKASWSQVWDIFRQGPACQTPSSSAVSQEVPELVTVVQLAASNVGGASDGAGSW